MRLEVRTLGDTKSTGIDGYNAKFFKATWDTIRADFKQAVRYFFTKKTIPCHKLHLGYSDPKD